MDFWILASYKNYRHNHIWDKRACAEAILEMLPHTRDFQELLSMGYSPEQAASHLLTREFEGQLDADTWSPPLLKVKESNAIDNERRF